VGKRQRNQALHIKST